MDFNLQRWRLAGMIAGTGQKDLNAMVKQIYVDYVRILLHFFVKKKVTKLTYFSFFSSHLQVRYTIPEMLKRNN